MSKKEEKERKEKRRLIKIIVGIVALLIVLIIILGTWAGYNGLVSAQEAVRSKESQYGAALDLCSEKIEVVYKIFQDYLPHESEIFQNVTKARSSFYDAAKEGNPEKTVEAGLGLEVTVIAVKENYPQLVSAPIAQQTIRSFEESIEEIKTALDDWIYQTQTYNTNRKFFPTNMVGDFFNFPKEFDYYHSEKAKLDVTTIIG